MSETDYPETVAEVLDDKMTFRPATLQAMRDFAHAGPWSGTVEARQEKFRELNRALSAAYEIADPELVFEALDGGSSGRSHYVRPLHRIVLVGKLSVVSHLHEFAHARGLNERQACRWSINLFRRIFPRRFSRLIQVGHMLVHPRAVRRRSTTATTNEGPATRTATDK